MSHDWRLFVPKTVTVLRQGYGLKPIRGDLVAGLTVAIVAMPLAMALAIASGATPERGLITAVVAGFLISLLGGSRFQIGGPTGAAALSSFLRRAIQDGAEIIVCGARSSVRANLPRTVEAHVLEKVGCVPDFATARAATAVVA